MDSSPIEKFHDTAGRSFLLVKLAPTLKMIQDSTENQFKIKYAHDLMAIDVKEDFNIYSINYNKKEK